MNSNTPEPPIRAALFTDLYELTMAQAYHREKMEGLAVFELYFRQLPESRNYMMVAGLNDVLDYIENWRFTDSDIQYLREQEQFQEDFLDRLRETRFQGTVRAMAEGTPVFPSEPIVQVTAPIFEAQLLETLIINLMHFETLAASKAARVVEAAQGRMVAEFGSRRAHALDAALRVARASYLAGAGGTSNVQAGKIYGVPIVGTMAHSYIQSHDDEYAAFEKFAALYPETTLLVDTYDTLSGVEKVIQLAKQLGNRFKVRAIRLDSGELADLAKKSRRMLDEAGLTEVKIFASGGLDEYKVRNLVATGAPIDAFGVGTRLAVVRDTPDIDIVYKLVEYDGNPKTKLATNKVLYPGPKQVHRVMKHGSMVCDVIVRADETMDGEPLLVTVMENGRRTNAGRVSLEEAREYARQQKERLPDRLRALEKAEEPYPVEASDGLKQALEDMRERLEREEVEG